MHQERERPVHNSDLHGIVAIGAANLCHSIKKNAIRQLSNFGLTHGVCGADQGTAGLSVVCRLEGVSPPHSLPPPPLLQISRTLKPDAHFMPHQTRRGRSAYLAISHLNQSPISECSFHQQQQQQQDAAY